MSSLPDSESLKLVDRPVSPISLVSEARDGPDSPGTDSTGTSKHEDPQDNFQSVNDTLLDPVAPLESTGQRRVSFPTGSPVERHVLYSLITIIAIGTAAMISTCWLIAYIQSRSDKGYIKAVVVGGKLSSTRAKLIDAAFSMLVSPAVIAIANWHMFKLARLSAVNEHRARNSAVSMKVLVEVAGTDWGSLSPLKFWTFTRSKAPRVICLGAIAVLSALSFSLLGNDTYSMLPQGTDQAALDKPPFQAEASYKLQYLLVRLQSTTLKSSEEGLLGVNVSGWSRSTLSPAVMQLFDASVYRLQLSCAPSNLQNVSIGLPDDHNPHLRIALEESPVSKLETAKYQAEFGLEKSFLTREELNNSNETYPDTRYPLVAFGGTAIWIGSIQLTQYDGLDGMIATKRWGNLSPFTQSNVAFPQLGTHDDSYNLTFSGVACHINRSTGRADVKVNGSDWSVIENTLFDEKLEQQHEVPILSFASAEVAFDDGARGKAPGLGGHLLRAALNVKSEASRPSWDLETLADAFLWYEMESRHVFLDNEQPNKAMRYQVLSNIDEYTMTFIPWILLSGLIALGVACGLSAGLSLDSWKVHSLRSGRTLDSIRLTADVGMALDKQIFEECSTWHGTRLNKCADEARFQYVADMRFNSETDTYSVGICLRQISRPHD
ncbi:hypothetical protein BKA59DRAFT_457406 [Fusarium tricinctum]|uniref:Uncharacterized protein n=1 Tax=Fusarium tricinctum TaxID=61284 RepID=A0A8K0RS54_9HYPO|nr:hypothetical protein BKA59DRAFT_457406 [Fusarium tricinctum]